MQRIYNLRRVHSLTPTPAAQQVRENGLLAPSLFPVCRERVAHMPSLAEFAFVLVHRNPVNDL